MKELYQEVLDFLWTRQQDGEKILKKGLLQKTESLLALTRAGFKFVIHLTLLKAYTLTCSRKYTTEYGCLTTSPVKPS